jgi:hypothetical protein
MEINHNRGAAIVTEVHDNNDMQSPVNSFQMARADANSAAIRLALGEKNLMGSTLHYYYT